jgi:hypothetical protein
LHGLVRKQIIWSVLRALCGYEVRIARRPHEARVFNRHVCSVQALVTWRPMSRLMTVGHSKSPRGCVRYIPSEHMFILVTSPTCPAIFGCNPHREPETARPYSPTLPVDAYSPQSKALRNRLFSQSCINPLVKMPRGLKSSLQNHYSQHC